MLAARVVVGVFVVVDLSHHPLSSFSARLFLSINSFCDCGPLGLVLIPRHPIPAAGSTEAVIQRTIESILRMIRIHDSPLEGEEPGIPINPAMKRHFELEIKALREAPRDPDKLRKLLKAKQREWEEARHIEDIQRLVTEIEMLKFVLFLVCRNEREKEEQ